jgi:CheY-like chemotaxis protein
LTAVLEEEGYDVRSAVNGAEALIEVRRWHPDLMLLDLMMPVMTGWDVLEAIGKIQRLETLSVVVFSAADDTRSTRRITRPLLRKPIDLDLLLEMVERLCDAQALGDEPPSDLFPRTI